MRKGKTMLTDFTRVSHFTLSALLAAVLAACANPAGIGQKSQLRDATSLGLALGAKADSPIAADWWREFNDSQLNRLVDMALDTTAGHSPSLKTAQIRLARAQAVTDVVNAAGGPQINAGLDLTHQRFTASGLYPPPLGGSTRDIGTLQLNGSWEFDFFGKNRAALDAALGSAQAAQADAQAARILLASQVARQYFQLARLMDQLSVARRTLAQREEALSLVQSRLKAGLDTRLELRQSEGDLPEARQQIEAFNEQAQLTRNALSALLGEPRAADTLIPSSLAAITSIATVNHIPADLLARRADIAAAQWRIEATGQDMVSAKAQFYPNINLVGFAGLSSIGLGRLVSTGSLQWGVGPSLHLPIFDSGRLRANLAGKAVEVDSAVESYNSAVIDALHDVADQIASVQSITRQQVEQRQAQAAADSAYALAVQRQKAGLVNKLQVLGAENRLLVLRRQQIDLSARALDSQVALIRALGGGYADASATALATVFPSNTVAAQ